jgi:hypothetical protein
MQFCIPLRLTRSGWDEPAPLKILTGAHAALFCVLYSRNFHHPSVITQVGSEKMCMVATVD